MWRWRFFLTLCSACDALLSSALLTRRWIDDLAKVTAPDEVHAFMAKRANSKETIVVKGASHVVMVSHPDAVATLIEHAATAK